MSAEKSDYYSIAVGLRGLSPPYGRLQELGKDVEG